MTKLTRRALHCALSTDQLGIAVALYGYSMVLPFWGSSSLENWKFVGGIPIINKALQDLNLLPTLLLAPGTILHMLVRPVPILAMWALCATMAHHVMVWLNLSNDGYDAETGVDVEKAESAVNRTGDRGRIMMSANMNLLLGLCAFITLILATKAYKSAVFLLCAVALGYVYQGPPFRLAYKGWGETLCVVAFTLATYAFYGMSLDVSGIAGWDALWASSTLGYTTSVVLANSHYHQVDTDRSAGKMSPAVSLGTEKLSELVVQHVAIAYWCTIFVCIMGRMPKTVMLFLPASLPRATRLCDFVLDNHDDKVVIKPAKVFALKWHFTFSMCVALGFFTQAAWNLFRGAKIAFRWTLVS